MSQISLRSVEKSYGRFQAVQGSSLTVEDGEFFSLLGPSGCGKSTTLRMIAGFIKPTAGSIFVAGQDVTNLGPERRNIGIVFQNYAIFPHMTVAQNVGYGLKVRRTPRAQIDDKVHRALAQVSLVGLGDRMPAQLSGGQLQRVALARVIILEPRLLLLDEPLSALDKKLRDEMRVWIKDLQRNLGITTIYVTHDQDEALSLSDRIAVMNRGVIEQIGTPSDIYEKPATHFVADFIGDSNLPRARITSLAGNEARAVLAGGLGVVCKLDEGQPAPAVGQEVHLLVRPERVLVGADAESADNRYRGRIAALSYHGSSVRFEAQLAEGLSIVGEQRNAGGTPPVMGEEVWVGWQASASHPLVETARTP